MIYWQSLTEFVHMGGYGAYVWGAYGLSAILLAVEVWQLRIQQHDLQAPIDETPT